MSRPAWRAFALVLVTCGGACVVPIETTSVPGTVPVSDAPSGPIPTGTWKPVTSNLANVPSICIPLSLVSPKPDEDLLITGVAQVGLYGSRDGGQTWQALGTGAGSAPIVNSPSSIVYDPTNHARFWESGIYGIGVYETMDDGNTFVAFSNVNHCDLVSVDFTDPNRQTLVAGGHEQSNTVYRSTDGGMTWANIGMGLPPNTNCTEPLVLDSLTYLVGCGGYGGGVTGIYRTTDGGTTWKQASAYGGGGPPLRTADGTIYWSGPGGAGVTYSQDDGMSWQPFAGAGLYDVLKVDLIELPDGRLASLGTQYVVAAAGDAGTWMPISSALPVNSMETVTGISYSTYRNTFYMWQSPCGSGTVPVPADAIQSYSIGPSADGGLEDAAPSSGGEDAAPSSGGEDAAPSSSLDAAPSSSSSGGEDAAPSSSLDAAPSSGGEDAAPSSG